MICKNCNNEIPEGGYFCPKCGTRCQEGVHPLLRKDETAAEEFEIKVENNEEAVSAEEFEIKIDNNEENVSASESENNTENQNDEKQLIDYRKAALKVGFIGGTRRFFKNRHKLKMRASRSEFWWGLLGALLHWGIVGFIKLVLGPDNFVVGVIGFLLMLPIYIGFATLNVRRLHDSGASGNWFWFILLPIVGWIILLVKCLKKSAEENKWGVALPKKLKRKEKKEIRKALKAEKKAAKKSSEKDNAPEEEPLPEPVAV